MPQIKMSTDKLNVYYGESHALRDVTTQIRAHAVTALIGPSGCGKSTFLKTLNRMNDLEDAVRMEGKVYLDGEDIYGAQMDVMQLRRRVGMVFQQPNPFPMSIYDNIAFGPKTHGIKKKAKLDEVIQTSLEDVGLWEDLKDKLKSSALSLSGGQQQRLCIARAIATNPEVLLMDEPTSALDPISTAKIEKLILNLKKEYTIIIVTHNMQQALRISDKTAFFLLGEMIEYEDTQKIFHKAKKQKTREYIEGRFG